MKNVLFYFFFIALSTSSFAQINNNIYSVDSIKINKSKSNLTESEVWTTHSDSTFSITYPSEWSISLSKRKGTDLHLQSPKLNSSDRYKENISLIIKDLTGLNYNFEKYITYFTQQVTKLSDSRVITFNQKSYQNGISHQKIIYKGVQGNIKLKLMCYIWLENNYSYVLTFASEGHKFDEYQTIGEKILKSFIINRK